jgi:zinc-ribbon domain
MQPEISRRCLKCGAAVRAGARFCPQCGQEFRETGRQQTPVDDASDAISHGVGGEAEVDGGIESLAARLSAELAAGGAPKTRDVEVGRDDAPTTRDIYLPALEGEQIVGEHVDASSAVGDASPLPGAGEAAASGVNASAVEGDAVGLPADDSRSRVARVRENTRARVENTKVRVGKMRDEALVALEETPDDSGLRFVLVAVAVFLLFVLFLFFSTSVLR